MSTILLTGASGFIGSRAIEPLLRAGHRVHAVSRVPRAHAGVEWHALDLLDSGATADLVARLRPELLLHLAWYAEHGRFWSAPQNLDWVGATLRLVREFRECGGRRAVLAGTCAEYEWGTATCSESQTPLRPASLYGTAKHATRLVADAYAREHELELAWGRIFFLYGPDEQPQRLLPSVTVSLLAGRPALTTNGVQVRDFSHVDDVAAGFAALLDSPATGPVNVASGQGVAVRRMVELAAEAAGRPDLVRFGAIPLRPGEPDAIVADVERLEREVGFRPRISLERGIADTVDWWRARQDSL